MPNVGERLTIVESFMPSPFPGMDPYLEHPALWPDVHHELISGIREQLNRCIRPGYVARVEERTYLPEADDPGLALYIPDVKIRDAGDYGARSPSNLAIADPVVLVTLLHEDIREARVEIIDTNTRNIVTVIEVISPSNKIPGSAGRRSFVEKRLEIMRSSIHWVEIDLLRGNVSLDPFVQNRLAPHDYSVHVSPVELRPKGRVWPIQLEQQLPTVGIPLRAPDADAPLDLQSVLTTAYERAAYDATIDYTQEPVPPLSKPQAKWAKIRFAKPKRK